MKKILQYGLTVIKSPVLTAILAALLFILFYIIYDARMNYLDRKIKVNETQTAIYKAEIDSMKKEKAALLKDISDRDEKMKNQMVIDSMLDGQISVLNNVIFNIQSKYEKAYTYANHYGSDSIRWYFSNLK
jgi:uncharacterized protein YdcH (DUF465 family)